MRRSDFIKSFVGLIGVAANINELALINTPLCITLSPNARIGDLVMNKDRKVFFFDGKRLRSVDGSAKDINAVVGKNQNNDYILFANAFKER